LANHFLRQLGLDGRKRFSNETLRVLQEYRWPGNVRELQRVVQAAVVLSEDDPVINACCVPKKCCGVAPTEPMERAIQPALSLSAEHPVLWPSQRIETELVFALEVKRRVKKYKGNQWKAEFMRIMYPECRAQNAKGFGDLIKRLTQGPWGCSSWKDDKKLSLLLEELIK